ncbi:hypothetical protein FKP32DRAFT_1652695 [Trametes sanguinea]|nr:hypothetical protein FKP32DRAFT_1652695 [Trametes sanguinea]
MFLTDLPEDIILDLCGHLNAHDIISLRQTCKALDLATRERTVWRLALSRHIQRSHLPVPNAHRYEVSRLSTEELERLTLQSLRYWSNWLSPQPHSHGHFNIRPCRLRFLNHHRSTRNLAVAFIPGIPDHLLTLTLYGDSTLPERYSFELWNIADNSQAIYMDTVAVAGLLGYAINLDAESSVTMTVTRRAEGQHHQGVGLRCVTAAYKLEVPRAQGSSCFRMLRQFDGFRNTIKLHGTRLVVTDAEQHVRIMDVDSGRLQCTLMAPMMLNDPTLRSAERQALDVILVDDFVLSFCKQYIFLYYIPLSARRVPDDSDSFFEPPELEAVATYKWQWRIDTLIAASRRSPQDLTMTSVPGSRSNSTSSTAPIIDVLTRFDTWFPWPVNILHHFVLTPNPAYRADMVDLTNPATFPYLLSSTEGPFMVHSIPSPVRIFTPSDVVLGQYGTALWIDASTDINTPSQAGDHGQRIAGKLLTQTPLPKVRLRPGEGPQDDQPSGSVDAAEQGPAVSVFHVQESDEKWNRVAVDEETGRIALGQVDGTVSVYSYVQS